MLAERFEKCFKRQKRLVKIVVKIKNVEFSAADRKN
jgi:hypothetical protein